MGQHSVKINAKINTIEKTIQVEQEIEYFNSSSITINTLYFNDWNNAFSDKNSPLGKRFSDEFIRAFHLAKQLDRGYTKIVSVQDDTFENLKWNRKNANIDLVEVHL
ncbi:MAG TPA: aminopeptidase, partial [Flavobacterium sp.]|nr:aminopeptidase [Flavobacterium sp.]